MKRVRCPKCDNFIIFDERNYTDGQALVFVCDKCGKEFGIRLGTSRLHAAKRSEDSGEELLPAADYGAIIVLENMFAYKQVLPLRAGDNVIGRYQKGKEIECPIESGDPSLDMHHCVLTVRHDKHGALQYVLRDGPSYTGTFVGGELLAKREQRIIADGTLFTLGATSIILRTKENRNGED
ncbi:MAG: FHA domain-containing protein [Prevotella sp.]|nr:FHA domain-containing protein [Prevotella sp.]